MPEHPEQGIPDNTPPDHPDEYPSPAGSGPDAVNYGYPFPVEGPTAPSDTPVPGTPVEYQPPDEKPGVDPNYPSGYSRTYGGAPPPKPSYPRMPNDPFNTCKQDQETEFGWGEGMHPDPILDYSAEGSRSKFPVPRPNNRDQQLTLAMIRRTDVASATAFLDPYAAGNPDRYGAGPPLVRKRGKFKASKYQPPKPPRMQREW